MTIQSRLLPCRAESGTRCVNLSVDYPVAGSEFVASDIFGVEVDRLVPLLFNTVVPAKSK